ncbi:glycerate kinase [Pseudanabaena biceps]|nr:glycerate kinase [Pseudanabaena biceps]
MRENIPIRIFELLIQGDRLSPSDNDLLITYSRKNNNHFQGLNSHILEVIAQRSHLIYLAYPDILKNLAIHHIQIDPPETILAILWNYWLPLAQSLAHQQQKIGRTFIQGLLGGQGTGKTTLGIILEILLRHLGKKFLSISLDDLYKTYADRQKLRDLCPQIIWRGPPITHDIKLGIQTLQQLRNCLTNNDQPIAIPRFDKSMHNGAGDRAESLFVTNVDIVLFEGWFVGMRPLPISAFHNFAPPIVSESDRKFALQCNAELANYLPLWEYLDSLIVLKPEDYHYSLQWRREAEHKLFASGKSGLSDAEITQFVEYFWKALQPELFMPPMLDRADLVVEISRSHLPTKIYSNDSFA